MAKLWIYFILIKCIELIKFFFFKNNGRGSRPPNPLPHHIIVNPIIMKNGWLIYSLPIWLEKNINCQEWDSNPCPFGPVPETGALDQLGHLDVDVVKFNNLFIFYGYILYTKAKPKNGTNGLRNPLFGLCFYLLSVSVPTIFLFLRGPTTFLTT